MHVVNDFNNKNIAIIFFSFTEMAYALYRGTRLGLALQEALGEMEEYEQISPNVRTAVLRKFDEVQDVQKLTTISSISVVLLLKRHIENIHVYSVYTGEKSLMFVTLNSNLLKDNHHLMKVSADDV